MKKLATYLLLGMIAFTLVASTAQASVSADINNQLNPVRTTYGVTGEPDEGMLAKAIADIIRIVLGFLGIIFVVLIVYAGFVWMLSGGNDEKIDSAKKTIIAATIGLAIVLAAYAITHFVIDALLKATGVSNSGL